MPYYDYIRIQGIATDQPAAENVQGIGAIGPGASGSSDSPVYFSGAFTMSQADLAPEWLTCLDTWQTAVKAWIDEVDAQLEAAETGMMNGEEYEELPFPEIPTLDLPVPLPPGTPPAVIIIIRIIEIALILWEMPIVRAIVRRIIRAIRGGGSNDVFLQMFRKFAFLQEGKIIPPVDLTSLLLLNADKPIEIVDGRTGKLDVFLDTLPEEP
jgi:hypothetical protein